MLTVRLSSVITGCGLNETTCSRISIRWRTRSTKGITIASPGERVLWNRPRRSTTAACACGMTLIVRQSVNRTRNAIPSNTMSAAIEAPLLVDERGSALDLDHLDPGARLEDVPLHVGAGRPFLAADADAAAVHVDALEDERLGSRERVGARPERRRH